MRRRLATNAARWRNAENGVGNRGKCGSITAVSDNIASGSLAPIVERTLSNGLKVYLFPVHESGRIYADLWFGVGAKHEKKGEFGISHFLEHMVFKGNERFGAGEIDRITESSGGYNNAATHSEYTHYYFVMPAAKLKIALTLLGEMCTRPAIDAAEFTREREVVMEEIKQYRDHPVYGAYAEHQARFYEGTAWGHNTLGTEVSLLTMTPETMRSHHKSFYRPENASLILTGGFPDIEKALKTAEAAFAGWKGDGSKTPKRSLGEFQPGESILLEATDNESVYGFLSMSAPGGDLSKESALLSVLLYVLGGTFSSKLHQALMEDEHLCQEFDFMSENTHPLNSLLFNFTTDDTAKIGRIIEVFRNCLHSAAESHFSISETSGAKAALIAHRAVDAESTPGAGSWLGDLAYPRRSLQQIAKYIEYMEKATPDELRAAAEALLTNLKRTGLTITYPRSMQKPVVPRSLSDFMSYPQKKRAATRRASKQPRLIAKLDSGVKVYGWPSPSSKLFAVKFYLPYNILEEPLAGISRIANHLMLKGTLSKTAVEISKSFESVGGSIGVAFSQMNMGIESGVLAADWRLPIETIPEMLSEAAFDDAELKQAVWQAIAALKTQKDQNRSVAWTKFAREFFPGSPFAVQPLGEEEGVAKITRSKVRKYAARLAGLDGMRIVVSGNYNESELIEKLTKELSRRKFSKSCTRAPDEGKFSGKKRRFDLEMDKEQSALIVGIPAPGIGSDSHLHWELINCILGVGATSRFFVNLRDRDSLAYAVFSMYIAGRRLGCLATTILTSREKLEQAWDGIFLEIRTLFDKGLTKTEFVAAKTFVVQQSLNTLETTAGKARELARSVLLGLSPEFPLIRLSTLKAISYDEFRDYLCSMRLGDWGAVHVGRE